MSVIFPKWIGEVMRPLPSSRCDVISWVIFFFYPGRYSRCWNIFSYGGKWPGNPLSSFCDPQRTHFQYYFSSKTMERRFMRIRDCLLFSGWREMAVILQDDDLWRLYHVRTLTCEFAPSCCSSLLSCEVNKTLRKHLEVIHMEVDIQFSSYFSLENINDR